MSKMIKAASAIALAAATSSVFAWYAAPYQPPVMTQEQQQAMVEQQQAFMEQQTKAMQEAFEAQKKAAEERMAKLQDMQGQYPTAPGFEPFAFPAAPAFPEMPQVPALGEYPAMPEMPAFPEIGRFPAAPAMPELAAPALPSSIQDRMKEMDAYRAESQKRMEARRAALKAMSEQRRAMRANRPFPYPTYGTAPGMMPAPQQQAAAPQDTQTSTE
ncbi:hypothetical protein [Thiorhodococcus minor]|uniref:Uncharacterized protein n=1 Tax=Thiorhodococcus minor TaxID=57489 RepID=A0A6M0JZI0_9GAMM|nr:hypothetical protein [Thiorhodococcus minor]NEV62906.1 hypothetical protein [Thiorhodococcus minor]